MTEDRPKYGPEAEITLDEWMDEQMSLLRLFALWYAAQQRQDPDGFPERMTPEEWDQRAQGFDPSGGDV